MSIFYRFSFYSYLCTRKWQIAGIKPQQTVRWMSGLVPGLQNQLVRFDSATHLKAQVHHGLALFFLYIIIPPAKHVETPVLT